MPKIFPPVPDVARMGGEFGSSSGQFLILAMGNAFSFALDRGCIVLDAVVPSSSVHPFREFPEGGGNPWKFVT